ncbi:MAG: NAD-dependent epimerase/dehydratase family protein [Acidobacteria bacterium]|nr:NAD-dependent epimerase/dehydratase family protein [Acidobacteriota bacterium]
MSGKILLTGGTGFVGSHLVDRLLEQGQAVRCLVRQSSNLQYLKDPRLEFAYGGLDEATDWDAAFADVDTVYHVAGLTFARRAQDYFTVNFQGTEAIIAAAIKHRQQIKKFVHVSSLAAIGPGEKDRPVDEDTPPAPITPYGRSKLMGEEAAMIAADFFPVTIVRPPAVYGPRDYALYEMFKAIAKGLSPSIGNYDKQLSLVHVFDLAEGIRLAAENDTATGRAYFIASDEVYSYNALVKMLAKIFARRVRSFALPRPVAYTVATLAELGAFITRKPPVINRDKVTDLSQVCWGCSIERAKKELGYQPKVGIEEGLRQTIQWYKDEGWL